MEDEKQSDIRVPLAFALFCLCVVTGGILLILYVFLPRQSQPWYPIAALVLIGTPWLFWFFTYIYTCIKACCLRRAAEQHRQISRRATTRNVSSAAAAADLSSASSKELPEMPLTSSV